MPKLILRQHIHDIFKDGRLAPRTIQELSTSECCSLRLVSKSCRSAVDRTSANRLFRTLRLESNGLSVGKESAGRSVGGYCREIVITLDSNPRPSGNSSIGSTDNNSSSTSFKRGATLSCLIGSRRRRSRSSNSSVIPALVPPPTEQKHWSRLFRLTPNLQFITISCPSAAPAWKCQTPLDQTLSAIRAAFETTNLCKLYCLNFSPIHVLGLLALRWKIGYTDASWMAGNVWANITELQLQLCHPGGSELNRDQQVMSMKVLHSFLEGIAEKCKRFTFCWLGQQGVAPVGMVSRAVAKGTGRFSAPEVNWPVLHYLWMGNVGVSVGEVCRVMGDGMPLIQELWVDGDLMDDTEGDMEMWEGISKWTCSGRLVWKFDGSVAVKYVRRGETMWLDMVPAC